MADFKDVSPEIILDKSILRERIVYRKNFGYFLNIIIGYPLFLLFVCFPWLVLVQNFSRPEWASISFCIVDLWFIVCIICRDKCVKIKGTNVNQNKSRIFEVLNECYDGLEFQVVESTVLRSVKSKSPVWGRAITAILNEDYILLNITRLGKTHRPTFVHGIMGYLRIRKIAKYFKEKYPV